MDTVEAQKMQQKWNKLIASLIEGAGLPPTCLIRLSFRNSDGQRYVINNFNTLNILSKQYADRCTEYLTLNINIEILALSVNEYLKRFKYEYTIVTEKHKLEQNALPKQFQLTALNITTAVIRQKIKHNDNHEQLEEKQTVDTDYKRVPNKRDEWVIGSECEIYSSSQKQWFQGVITGILDDSEGEWLKVQYTAYDIRKNKQVQRYNNHIRPIVNHKDISVDGKDNKKNVVYGYLDEILDGLNQSGYRDMNEIVPAIKDILNTDTIMRQIQKKKLKTKMKDLKKKKRNKKEKDDLVDIIRKIDGWKCTICTLINYKDFKKCIACSNPKPVRV